MYRRTLAVAASVTLVLAAAASSRAQNGNGTFSEPAFFDGRQCDLMFGGTPSRTADVFFIWNLGHGMLPAAFDTSRPNLYAILPGTQHVVPGFPDFDHDHVTSHGPGSPGYDGTWDVWVVVPGPAFHADTYVGPRSESEMFQLIALGVLQGPFGFADAGFPRDLVLRAPLACRHK
jgi:hypothetical protein